MTITVEQYVGPHADSPDWTPERQDNAAKLLAKCAILQGRMEADGVVFHINSGTGSQVSGQTFGGFRPQSCPQGAPKSTHKQGRGVDQFDPHGEIDAWLMARPKVDGWPDVLVELDMAIEHPDATVHWSHWQDGAPPSGHRVFHP
jgi:hypothetical protein